MVRHETAHVYRMSNNALCVADESTICIVTLPRYLTNTPPALNKCYAQLLQQLAALRNVVQDSNSSTLSASYASTGQKV